MKEDYDLFEFPCVDPAVVEVNFFKSEFYKRHFEEFGDNKDVNYVLNKFEEYLKFYDGDYKKALSKSRQIIINYGQRKNKKNVYDFYNIIEEFDVKFFESWIDKAYKLSLKYRLSVFDLVCPNDFQIIVKSILLNSFKPEVEVLFDNQIDGVDVGYVFNYDKQLKKISMVIDVSDDIQDSELLVSNAARALVLLKRNIGLAVSDADRNLLIQASKEDIDKNYRTNGRYARAIGVAIWDLKKEKKFNLDESIKYLRKNELIYRKGMLCAENCGICVEINECKRLFRDYYRNVCESISKSQIIPTSESGKSIKKLKSKFQFKRYGVCEL